MSRPVPPPPPLQQVTQPVPTRRSSRSRRPPPVNNFAGRIIATIFAGIVSVILAWGIYNEASKHFQSAAEDMAKAHNAKVENLERQILALSSQLGKTRESIRSTASELKGRDTALEDAKHDIDDLKTKVGDLAGANEKLMAEKSSLEKGLADLGEELMETTEALEKEWQKQPEPNAAIAAWRTWTIDMEEVMEEVKARFVRKERKEGNGYITLKMKNGVEKVYKETHLSKADLEFIADNSGRDRARPANSAEENKGSDRFDDSGAAVDMSKARAIWLVGLRREGAGEYDRAASLYGRASRYMDEEDRAKALEVVKRMKAFGAASANAERQAYLNRIGRNTCGSLWMGPVYGWYGGGGQYIHIEHIIRDPEPPAPKRFKG